MSPVLTDSVIADFLSDHNPRQLNALKQMAMHVNPFPFVRDAADEIVDRKLVYRLLELVQDNNHFPIQYQAWKLLKNVISTKDGLKQSIEHNALSIFCDFSSESFIAERISALYYIAIFDKYLFLNQINLITNIIISLFVPKHISDSVKWNTTYYFTLSMIILKRWNYLTIKQIANVLQITGIYFSHKTNKTILKTFKSMSETQYNNQSYLDNVIIFMQQQPSLLCHGFIREAQTNNKLVHGIIMLCIKYLTPKNIVLERLTQIYIINQSLFDSWFTTDPILRLFTPINREITINSLVKSGVEDRYFVLDIIANIENNDTLIELVVNYDILKVFAEILSGDVATKNKKLTLWILSNICTISSHIVQSVIEHGIIDILIGNIMNRSDDKLIEDSLWCLCNTTMFANDNQKECMMKKKAIVVISQCLESYCNKYKLVLVGLEGLENLLSIKSKINIEFCGESPLKSMLNNYLNESHPPQITEKCQMIIAMIH